MIYGPKARIQDQLGMQAPCNSVLHPKIYHGHQPKALEERRHRENSKLGRSSLLCSQPRGKLQEETVKFNKDRAFLKPFHPKEKLCAYPTEAFLWKGSEGGGKRV